MIKLFIVWYCLSVAFSVTMALFTIKAAFHDWSLVIYWNQYHEGLLETIFSIIYIPLTAWSAWWLFIDDKKKKKKK